MKNILPAQCPICEGELIITDVVCTNCDTHMNGVFSMSGLSKLDSEQLEFVEVFIKCRGSIKEMEKELGVSYPTVKSRLEQIAKIMGFENKQRQEEDRMDILEGVRKGEISVDDAINLLKE